MDFELRPARPADVEAIMQVMADAMANLKHPEWFVPDDAVYMAEHISGPKGFCLVAEEKTTGALAAYFTVKLAGTAPDALGWQLGMSEEELNATAQMDSCCVAPPYQGNGLEGKLLLMAEDTLRGSRYRHLLATVHPDNAASLYTGLHRGYTIAADHVICYGDKVRDILRKDLLREISAGEVNRLEPCVRALADYHNRVSSNFKGSYPSRPYAETLERFAAALAKQQAKIAVAEAENEIAGFCKVDFDGAKGKLDYLIVQEAYRGKGYGRKLMDWAMEQFKKHGVQQIEVKVVDGNPAIHLYEAYGFCMNAHILVRTQEYKQE